ncbi:MAG TPA: hypothetical protein VGG45_17390 [Terracidiphilus sp.]|jgi:hypothetical protein
MKKIKTLVFAASVAMLTLAACPKPASAAADAFLQLGGIKGESSQPAPTKPANIVLVVISILMG